MDGAWERARGIALHPPAVIVACFAETNPDLAAPARPTIDLILAT